MPTPEGVDLKAAHFKYGDTSYCQITVVPPAGSATTNLSLVALMDVSGSMGAAATVERGGQQVDVGFSVLDITKHAMKTVVETLKDADMLSVVAFSNQAKIVSPLMPMTQSNKDVAKQHITEQIPSGCTNMWDALDKALEILEKAGVDGQLNNSLPSILFFTDGMPSEHLLPPNGILQSLKDRMAKIVNFKPTIHTFGFGYDLDTPLLVDISLVGDGAFSFIPDSGFVGTVLVHAVANLATCVGAHAKLKMIPQDGARIKRIVGYGVPAGPEGGSMISIDSIHFGQNKTVLIEMAPGAESVQVPLNTELHYVNSAGTAQSLNGAVQTVGSETADFRKESLRAEFTELLMTVLQNGGDIQLSQVAVNVFLDKWSAQREEGVYVDCEGQVKIAVSQPDFYKRWGANYISSLMMAHRQQRCNNFKDKGVANYGGELFDAQRDSADEIFTSMPPPVPSRRPAATADSKPDTSSFSMSNFNDADNPCFHEDALVHLADGSKVPCKELQKGDAVATASGKLARVVCAVRTECAGNTQQMVTLPSGLRVTPWHPVRVPGSSAWAFPADLAEVRPMACAAVYSFVLDAEHVLTIEGVECVALAHGFEAPVAQHEYYGTDRVLRDLAAMPGFEEGLLSFRNSPVLRGVEGKVMGFDQRRLRAAVVRSDAN